MRYLVTKSVVQVVGHIWMPNVVCAMDYELSGYDLENIRNEEGTITREDVQGWLDTHAGDFRSVDDFRVDIADGDQDIVFEWQSEEGEFAYADAMYPAEES